MLPVIRVGQARVTAGLDHTPRLDLPSHRAVFGFPPTLAAAELIGICEEVDLRGRGGAAFPVARKLRAVLTAAVQAKTGQGKRRAAVVVNCTEGEPGSAKDKILLARAPHLVLDGALVAASALRASEIVVAVAGDGPHLRSLTDAVGSDSALARKVRVVSVPDRFVSGESGALVNAINGNPALPPGTKTRASDSGVHGMPTLLSNAETFAQLAVLALLGPAGFASVGTGHEPGTVLLTVGGSVSAPAVVETPSGVPLGYILDICGAQLPRAVLVGGYHGMWLHPGAAYDAPVSRAGMAAAGGTLGAGVVLVLGQDTCPLGEVTRVAGYLAMQSSGQCGPCKLGLPAVARSLAAITAGAGGVDELEALRRAAGGVRGRGACHHPDGASNFVASALEVFADDLIEHIFHGSCGRPASGILPLPADGGDTRLTVDWTRCRGHGLCARLIPELVELDQHGYPRLLEAPVPFWLSKNATQAVDMCPSLALSLTADQVKPAAAAAVSAAADPPSPLAVRARQQPQAVLTGRAWRRADLDAAEAWLAEIGGPGPARPL
ncbi:MAG TPA: NADH-ubiquinone oxidoreductase-F iron-sulfur binding region domain-containing protein [Streptosporangiaceae bacterium]|nr:NADH-ubiquinone oxidoreductase-F iron-sulfur binding region domain-containing protein [Streptosporangiaceae bacterium]